jgi:hypothetical protein
MLPTLFNMCAANLSSPSVAPHSGGRLPVRSSTVMLSWLSPARLLSGAAKSCNEAVRFGVQAWYAFQRRSASGQEAQSAKTLKQEDCKHSQHPSPGVDTFLSWHLVNMKKSKRDIPLHRSTHEREPEVNSSGDR